MAIFGSIYNDLFGDGGKDSSKDALSEIQNIPLPVLKEMYPELYKQVVTLNPEMETAVSLGPSASEGIILDPVYKKAQTDALNSLMDITSNDGRDAKFQADSARLQNDINTNLKGNSDAITQNMAMRGLSGGMSEMVNKQIASQNASDRQAQLELDLNAQAQERALQALMNQGQLAGSMSQNEFNQKLAKTDRQDAISKFNTQNQQQVISNNVGAKNSAQQFNAQTAQNVANQNTETNNAAQKYNLSLPQQEFQNRMTKSGAVSNGYNNIANREDDERNKNASFWGNLISSGASAYAGSKGK